MWSEAKRNVNLMERVFWNRKKFSSNQLHLLGPIRLSADKCSGKLEVVQHSAPSRLDSSVASDAKDKDLQISVTK